MKISIVTVCFNAEATIAHTIQSVLSQKNVDLEYIVVDGASKDSTPEIVKSFGNKISTFVSEPDRGIYDAMNKGISLCSGEIVGILNADDFYADDYVLARVVSSFLDGVDAVYGDLVYVDQADTSKVRRTWISGKYVEGAFKKGWMPPHPTFFVRKSIYEKFGGYTLDLQSAADYEWMLRVVHKHGIRLVYLPELLVRMRTGGKSNVSLKNRIRANREDKKAWEMNGLKPGTFTFVRKPLSKLGQFFSR